MKSPLAVTAVARAVCGVTGDTARLGVLCVSNMRSAASLAIGVIAVLLVGCSSAATAMQGPDDASSPSVTMDASDEPSTLDGSAAPDGASDGAVADAGEDVWSPMFDGSGNGTCGCACYDVCGEWLDAARDH